jgi:hypothetical protein
MMELLHPFGAATDGIRGALVDLYCTSQLVFLRASETDHHVVKTLCPSSQWHLRKTGSAPGSEFLWNSGSAGGQVDGEQSVAGKHTMVLPDPPDIAG